MRFIIQRVKHANVQVEEQGHRSTNKTVGEIENGLLVFVGISANDNKETADKMIKKLLGLRIFEDMNGKTNLDLQSVSGSLLIISQFTLYADCRKGNRPSFVQAGPPDMAKELYEYILDECKKTVPIVQHGIFGAYMKVSLVNDGPFTIILDSDEICR